MIDLHTHSYYSDGTCSPAQLVAQAQDMGLHAIALCDHNTVEGLPAFMAAGENSTVETVPGIELSTEYNGTELHVLALFIQPAHYGPITALLEEFRLCKEQSNIQLTEALRRAGLDIDYSRIRAEAEGYVNRAVIGAELTRKGYTASVQEAFRKYLDPVRGFYIPPKRLDTLDAIGFVKELGAVAVLAHPFLNLEETRLRQFLFKAVACGLDGMEILYSRYDSRTTELSRKIAEEFGILPSGGSDFHGRNKPDIRLGTGRGNLEVPDEFLQKLAGKLMK